jgi:uncharacterized membrane protein (DUF485 family)
MRSLDWCLDPANRTDVLAFVFILGLITLSGAFLGLNLNDGGIVVPTPLAILPAVAATIVAALVATDAEGNENGNEGY